MQRKDYELLAQALMCTKPPHAVAMEDAEYIARVSQWIEDVMGLADAMAYHNPRFNRFLFLRACDCPAEWESFSSNQ